MSWEPGQTEFDEDRAECQQMWREQLQDFEEHFWPIFHAYGYTKGVALQVYMLDRVESAIHFRRD